MKKESKIAISTLAKKATRIKINKNLDSIEDTAFFKKKMRKGKKMLSAAGLPKL